MNVTCASNWHNLCRQSELQLSARSEPAEDVADEHALFDTTINGHLYKSRSSFGEVNNDSNAGTVDATNVRAISHAFLGDDRIEGPTLGGVSMVAMQITFWDDTATAFDSIDLPQKPIELTDFNRRFITFLFIDSNDTIYPIRRQVASLSGTVIPEPSTIAIWSVLVLVVVGVQWRRSHENNRHWRN